MSSKAEIERKFFVEKLPEFIQEQPSSSILQGYISGPDDSAEVRLRRKDAYCLLTVKRGNDLLRSEQEVELTEEQFEQLWPLTEGRRVEKTRYTISWNGVEIEVDVYHRQLQGLVIAEVEFDSIEQSGEWNPPEWIGCEVTYDKRYKNRYLAFYGEP
jgi:CYTH domain-containing protein